MMAHCRIAALLAAFSLLTLFATGCVEPVRSRANPYSFQILVGEWTWRPLQTSAPSNWAGRLTIIHVSDAGLVTAVWGDTGTFTTWAKVKEGGNITLAVGVIQLEYDRDTDTLTGPVTGGPPSLDAQARSVFKSAYFRRTK